jgi:hypothetical protein
MRMSLVHELLRMPSLTELQLPGDVWFVWDKERLPTQRHLDFEQYALDRVDA